MRLNGDVIRIGAFTASPRAPARVEAKAARKTPLTAPAAARERPSAACVMKSGLTLT